MMKILSSTYGKGTVSEYMLKNSRQSKRQRNEGIVAMSTDGHMQEVSILLSPTQDLD